MPAKTIDVVVLHPNLYYQGVQRTGGETIAMECEALTRTDWLASGVVELKTVAEARKQVEQIKTKAQREADALMKAAAAETADEAPMPTGEPDKKSGPEKKAAF